MKTKVKLLIIVLLVATLGISSIICVPTLTATPQPEVLILVTQRLERPEQPDRADYFYNFMLAYNLSKVGAKVHIVFASYGTYAARKDVLAQYEIEKPDFLRKLTGIKPETLKDFALALKEKKIDICVCMACPVRFGFSMSLTDIKWVDPIFRPVSPLDVAEMIKTADKVITR